jgi:hypothetical protein
MRANAIWPRDRRTQPARQRTMRLYARVDCLEDAISHFYNVISQLRERVSTLEKKLNFLAKDDRTDRIPNADEKPESCYCSALPKGSGPCLPCYTRWLASRRSKGTWEESDRLADQQERTTESAQERMGYGERLSAPKAGGA